MRRGLVVGKFMPLHRGHQFLIDSALALVDELTVVVYDTYVDRETAVLMPAHKRAGWIQTLYPQVTNVVVRQDILTELTYEERDKPEYAQAYADDLKFLGQFTHVFSSENYGEPFAKALQADHIIVDVDRGLMPISGTQVRTDLFKHRAWMDPIVYRSLIQKVVFVGTESTGKSTISKALAEKYNTLWVHEYGRELWEEPGHTPRFEDFWKIGETQYAREQAAALHANKYLFCDTNAWTTYQWSKLYYGTADQKLIRLANSTVSEYAWFMCGNEFGWVDDGRRELKNNSRDFQIEQQAQLMRLGVPLVFLTGSVEERMRRVEGQLGISEKCFSLVTTADMV